MGRKRKKNKKYTPEFKVRVIMDMREHGLEYSQTSP